MNDLRTAAQQALEALYINYRGAEEAARILKAALAEPEKLPMVEIETVLTVQAEPVQEPVATCDWPQCGKTWPSGFCKCVPDTAPLNLNDPAVQKRLAAQWGYAPQRKPLTEEEEILKLMNYRYVNQTIDDPDLAWIAESAKKEVIESARAIERAHGIGADDAQV